MEENIEMYVDDMTEEEMEALVETLNNIPPHPDLLETIRKLDAGEELELDDAENIAGIVIADGIVKELDGQIITVNKMLPIDQEITVEIQEAE